MKGHILHISDTEVLIRADDQNKYTCDLTAVKSDTRMVVGDPVDFEVRDGRAVELYNLRVSSHLDTLFQSAKEKTSTGFSNAKSQLNEENIEKLKSFGRKAKPILHTTLANIKPKSTQMHNKSRVISLLTLFVCGFIPLVEVWGDTYTFYEVAESYWMAVFAILAAATAYFGANLIAYRTLTSITLLFVAMTIYEIYRGLAALAEELSGFSELAPLFGGTPSGYSSVMEDLLSDLLTIGTFILPIVVIFVIISLKRSGYQTAVSSQHEQE